MAPLEVLTPSSPFGYRVSPLTGARGDFHLGQDYAARCGTRVYAADSGVVRAAGWHPWGGGNRVEIDHGNGLITTYNHLDAIAVRTGDSVQVGQVIARVGTTGWSTGCHLHFETILGGKHTSPLNWTLIPIRQLDDLADIAMVSFEAGPSSPAAEALRWAIPVAADQTHRVLFGDDELRDPPGPDPTAPASESATPTGSASPTGTSTASETPTPTGTSPSGTATPSPTGTSPSGTATPSPTTTPSTTTATPTPTPTTTTATPTPTPTTTTTTPTPTPTTTTTTATSGRRDRRTQEPTPTPTTDPTTATGSAIADPGSGETSALPTAGS
ncbi:M23 family metallopeptidase [Pseudarthrobacter sp. YS3]